MLEPMSCDQTTRSANKISAGRPRPLALRARRRHSNSLSARRPDSWALLTHSLFHLQALRPRTFQRQIGAAPFEWASKM